MFSIFHQAFGVFRTHVAPRREVWAFVASCLVGLWLALTMPVFAQEAYYWCYAQRIDLSYYDHPPMVAWLIWVGTHVFGNGPLGVRVCTWLCASLTTWLGVIWLREIGGSSRARMAFLVCRVAVPLCAASYFLANPDSPLSFFWMLSMYSLWRARDGGLGWWLLGGLAAGCGLLSKYTAGFLAVGGVIVMVLDPKMRRQWRRPGPFLAILAAAVAFLPVVVWNVGNDFESFRFQAGRFTKAEFGAHWLLQFLAGQVAVFHPVLALAVPVVVVRLLGRLGWREPRSIWLLAFGLPLPLFFAASALFIQVKINWLLPAFPSLLCGVVLWWDQSEGRRTAPRLLHAGARAVVATAVVLPVLAPLVALVRQSSGSSWTGWDVVTERVRFWATDLDRRDGIADNVFLATGNYRDAAQLTRGLVLFHEASHCSWRRWEKSVLAQNVFGDAALQFDHWDAPLRHFGEDAIYVMWRPELRPHEPARLSRYFSSVDQVERVRIERLGCLVACADIYQCRGYLGPQPENESADVPH